MATRAAVTPIGQRSSANIANAVHPRYSQWLDTWRWLGWVFEGDGPFANGDALVPYPREVIYQRDNEGNIVKDSKGQPTGIGYLPKFQRRKELACYDNLAAEVINVIVDHQFQKMPDRAPADGESSAAVKDYQRWAETDVDGAGTCLDDWMKQSGRLADVYGHLFVTLERRTDGVSQPQSAAELAPLVLRRYTPIDAPDWILDASGALREVKLLEAVPRDTLEVPVTTAAGGLIPVASLDSQQDAQSYEVRRWTPKELIVYDSAGTVKDRVPHELQQPPVLVMYARRRARIPLIGCSLIGDPKRFKDLYNISSEMRELMRAQTFSTLAIGLGDDETLEQGRAHLGQAMSVENVMFFRGDAKYIAPPEGPLAQYMDVADRIIKRIYQSLGLSFDGDSHEAETAASRRIKAMDLNRVLAGLGDESELFESSLARLWLMSQMGREPGLKEYDRANLRCAYPDDYFVESAIDKLEEIRQTVGLGFGATFAAKIRKSAVPVLLPGVSEKDMNTIGTEIEAEAERQQEDELAMDAATTAEAEARASGDAGVGNTNPTPPSAEAA